jgi:hypothetical protein
MDLLSIDLHEFYFKNSSLLPNKKIEQNNITLRKNSLWSTTKSPVIVHKIASQFKLNHIQVQKLFSL